MRITVHFQDEQLDLDVPEDRLVGSWDGPKAAAPGAIEGLTRGALEGPSDFPPLRRAVVPGDQVVIPLDPTVPEADVILSVACEVLRGAGVEPEAIRVLVPGDSHEAAARIRVPERVAVRVHDPEDRAEIAYLASTTGGRRIYLDRLLTDADVVVPIGRLGHDPALGYRGPWSVIFPGLSDAETLRAFRSIAANSRAGDGGGRPELEESAEVGWLLGCQLQIGVTDGVEGATGILAGLGDVVRAEGARLVDRDWTFRPPSRADLVVVGVGRPGWPTGIEALGDALATATRLVRRGGRIVALSRAGGRIGPSLRRLIEHDDPRTGPASLKGFEDREDYPAARRLAEALAWADVYLLSELPEEVVDGLSLIGLGRPEEARRLVAAGESCLVVSQADRVRVSVADEAP